MTKEYSKRAQTCIERHGEDFYRIAGKKGGSVKCRKGFATNPQLAKEAVAKRWANRKSMVRQQTDGENITKGDNER